MGAHASNCRFCNVGRTGRLNSSRKLLTLFSVVFVLQIEVFILSLFVEVLVR
jgi:hypothetical protein